MIARYSRKEMSDIWTDDSRFKLWLKIELLALEKMVDLGLAPAKALESCKAKASFSAIRIAELEKEVKHDVIAFLSNVAEYVGEDARYLHLGMTSSDLLDTAFAVQLKNATELILAGLDKLCESVKKLAFAHKKTICIGRSHGIHAEPTTFGLKVAVWYDALKRHDARIRQALKDVGVGAISGPVGTYAHLTPKVEEFVCKSLGLKPANTSTQVIQRDNHAALFLAFAGLAATFEQICIEIRHLQRTEVREAEEAFTKGQKGSSAMPHKRNPILSENVTGLARLVRNLSTTSLENVPLWHERDISHSSVERVIAPDITIAMDFILTRLDGLISNLKVYPDNMRRNLDLTKGLYFSGSLLVALANKGMSRDDAYLLVQQHALDTWDSINEGKSDKSFPDRIRGDAKISKILSTEELEAEFSLDRHVAHVDFIFERVFGSEGKRK